ncbi:MAG: DUF1566 domain-containing protein, partial [Desulfobacterales bacterium]
MFKKTTMITLFMIALAVSSVQAAFQDNHDGTVTDTASGLMWQKCSMGQTWNAASNGCDGSASAANWQNALWQSENLSLAGHSDWRLPNRNELQFLQDYSRYNPAIDTTSFPATMSSFYWSSTTYASYTGSAWVVDFDYGGVYGDGKSRSYYVRAVRAGQTGGSLGDLVISGLNGDNEVIVGQDIAFSLSSDAQIIRCDWDFNNDGYIDDVSQDTTITHTFTTEGDYVVRVAAVDSEGNNIVAFGTIRVISSPEITVDFSFQPWHPSSDSVVSRVMKGGKAVRYYRLLDSSGTPLVEKKFYYLITGGAGVLSAQTDDQGFVAISTPSVDDISGIFQVTVTDSAGLTAPMNVTGSPSFYISVDARDFMEEYEMLLGVGGAIGLAGPGVEFGPVEFKTLKAAIHVGRNVANKISYASHDDSADFEVTSSLGSSLGLELSAGLFGGAFKNVKMWPSLDVGWSLEGEIGSEFSSGYGYPNFVENMQIIDERKALEVGIILVECAINARKQLDVGMDTLLSGLIDKYFSLFGTDLTASKIGFGFSLAGESSLGAELGLQNPFGLSGVGSRWNLSWNAFDAEYLYELKTISDVAGTKSLQQNVTTDLDIGSFSLSFSQTFGDKRRKDSPKLQVSDLIDTAILELKGDEGVKITQYPDTSQKLEFFHLTGRSSDSFLVVGSEIQETYLHISTDNSEVIDDVALSSELAMSLRNFTDDNLPGFELSPDAYLELLDSLLNTYSGEFDWEQWITERKVVSIPLDFAIDLGVSLGLGIEAETVSSISYIAKRGTINEGVLFVTDSYEKDDFISDNIK